MQACVFLTNDNMFTTSKMTNGHHHKREMLTITKKGNLLSCHIYFLWRPGELDCHVAAPASLPRLVADLIIKNRVIKIIKIVKIIKNLIIKNK